MKKIAVILFVTINLLFVSTLTACGDCEHEWGEWSVASSSTCTTQGTKERKCFECDEVQTESLDIAEHKYDTENIVWTWNGYESATATFTCVSDNTHTTRINAVVTNKITTASTCAIKGVKTYTATAEFDGVTYNDVKNEELPTIEHTEEIIPGKAATCTESGLTDGKKCSVCKQTVLAQSIIGATDHKWDTDNIVWTWSGYESACADVVCVNDKNHIRNITADISVEVVKSTYEEEGYTSYIATVDLDGRSYTDVKKTLYVSLEDEWNAAIEAFINTSNGTLVEEYIDYYADGTVDYAFSYIFELADNSLKCSFTYGGGSYVQYYTYEDGIYTVYEYIDGEWVKGVCDNDGYAVSVLNKGFGKEALLLSIKELYSTLSYDGENEIFTADDIVIAGENYIDCSIAIKDGVVTQIKATRVYSDKSMRYICFSLSDCGSITVVPPHVHDWDDGMITKEPTEAENGEKTYSCSGCGETHTEIIYARSESDWNSVFDALEYVTDATFIVNTSCVYEDEIIEGIVAYYLDNYKAYYLENNSLSNESGYIYYTKIDGAVYVYTEKYLGGEWVWTREEIEFDLPFDLAGLLYPLLINELKDSYSEFEYDAVNNTYSSKTLILELGEIAISDISIVIADDKLVGINYTTTYEDGSIARNEAVIFDYGTTEVELPEAITHFTHSFTVFEPSNLRLCCEFCDEYLRVDRVEAVYVGNPIRFIGDVVSEEDFSVTLYYENGTVLNCENFTLDNTTLEDVYNNVGIICGDDYWRLSAAVRACPNEYTGITDDGLVYLEKDETVIIVAYVGTSVNVVIPEYINDKIVTEIGDDVFYLSDISTVELPDGLIAIGSLAFHSCYNLKAITIPQNVTNIGIYAFAFSGLSEIFIPENVRIMGSSVLRGCNSLTNITVSEKNQYYSSIDGNLYNKDGTILENYALGKTATSFVVPQHVLMIGCDAFSFSNNLLHVTIPASVKTIEINAFYNYSTKLVSVTFENTDGWVVDGEAVNVSDSQQNAIYLTETYSDYTWECISDTNPDGGNGEDSGNGGDGDTGNTGDGDSENDNDSGADVEHGKKESFVSYSQFQAEWYAREFSGLDFSYSNEFLTKMENDEALMFAINAWTAIHIFAEPNYLLGEMTKEDLYKIVIYDLLTGNSGEFENPLDLFANESMNFMNDAVKIIFGDEFVEMDYLKAIDPDIYDETVLNSEFFKGMDAVSFIFDTFDNLYDALEACGRYKAISNMSEGFKNVLVEIHNDTTNDVSLRNAAKECIEYVENACNTTMDEILKKEFVSENYKNVVDKFAEDFWEFTVGSVFPEVIIAQFAAKGVVVLCDSLFNLDATNRAFYQLEVAVGFENAVRKILDENEFDYSDTAKCENYLYAVEVFQRSVLLGLDYSADLLQCKVDSFIISPSTKQEYITAIAQIEDMKEKEKRDYQLYVSVTKGLYEEYLDLGVENETPITAMRLLLAVGAYNGSYTAPQGETGVSVFIHLKNELLQNAVALGKYAEYATECSKNGDGVIQNNFSAEDIKEIIRAHSGDFIVVFKYGPTIDNPNVEDGLYTMSIYYDWESRIYNMVGSQWIQHDTYQMVDLRYVSFVGSTLSGDIYGDYADWFITDYRKLGEILATR